MYRMETKGFKNSSQTMLLYKNKCSEMKGNALRFAKKRNREVAFEYLYHYCLHFRQVFIFSNEYSPI